MAINRTAARPASFPRLRTPLLGLLFALLALPASVLAVSEVNSSDGAVARGHDVVAYFTEGRPVKGSAEFSTEYEGGVYHFSSAENLEAFEAEPARYAPAYGGYCAFGAAHGYKVDIDPTAWRIVDDTLYLNLNPNVQQRWVGDIPGYIRSADHNWPLIRSRDVEWLKSNDVEGVNVGTL